MDDNFDIDKFYDADANPFDSLNISNQQNSVHSVQKPENLILFDDDSESVETTGKRESGPPTPVNESEFLLDTPNDLETTDNVKFSETDEKSSDIESKIDNSTFSSIRNNTTTSSEYEKFYSLGRSFSLEEIESFAVPSQISSDTSAHLVAIAKEQLITDNVNFSEKIVTTDPISKQMASRAATLERSENPPEAVATKDSSPSDLPTTSRRDSNSTGSKSRRLGVKGFFEKTFGLLKQKSPPENVGSDDASENANKSVEIANRLGIDTIEAAKHFPGKKVLTDLHMIQDLTGHHRGAIWVAKFSSCGKLLGTAGQDSLIRVWVLKSERKSFGIISGKSTSSRNSSHSTESSPTNTLERDKSLARYGTLHFKEISLLPYGPFHETPMVIYKGHSNEVLDLSWSQQLFLLSSSMDKTVRLWHIFRKECLCCFQHTDFVTSISFYPIDDRHFLSGSLDGKIRLWNIPNKKVVLWNEVPRSNTPIGKMVTSANYCRNGTLVVVGTYDGRCVFYTATDLKYHTQIQITSQKTLCKVTGVEPVLSSNHLLVTTSDSRIRLYDLRDYSLVCKYKGHVSDVIQVKAKADDLCHYILCGSKEGVFIWRREHISMKSRRDRNAYYECYKAHDSSVSCASFAPFIDLVFESLEKALREQEFMDLQEIDDEQLYHSSVKNPSSANHDADRHRAVDNGEGEEDRLSVSSEGSVSGFWARAIENLYEQHDKKKTEGSPILVIISADINGSLRVFTNIKILYSLPSDNNSGKSQDDSG